MNGGTSASVDRSVIGCRGFMRRSWLVAVWYVFPALNPKPCWGDLTWGVHPIARYKLLPHLNPGLAVCGREAKRGAIGRSAAIGVPI